jgi:hypothetical protein
MQRNASLFRIVIRWALLARVSHIETGERSGVNGVSAQMRT